MMHPPLYNISYTNMSRTSRSRINNNVFVKLGYTFIQRVTHLINYFVVDAQITSQDHITFTSIFYNFS